jgi:hypothetical protein
METESDDDRREERPSPSRLEAAPLAHVRDAWRSWLSALATDADAALAAAMAYESLAPEARDAWLDTLVVDCGSLEVPVLALYAPLLAVEGDGVRRRRIEEAIASDPRGSSPAARDVGSLRGVGADGTHACVIVAPVYLDFVQVLACRYTPSGGIVSVEHEPLRHAGDLVAIREVGGVAVEPTPLGIVIEELAHAILADKRGHRGTPEALRSFAYLFAPEPG